MLDYINSKNGFSFKKASIEDANENASSVSKQMKIIIIKDFTTLWMDRLTQARLVVKAVFINGY